MKKFERKTLATKADFLYGTLPTISKFFENEITGNNFEDQNGMAISISPVHTENKEGGYLHFNNGHS